jgi:hypothetical protein
MKLKQGLFYLGNSDIDSIYNSAKFSGWKVFEIDGNIVHDKYSFFVNIRTVLPLDPPLISNNNWDALSDSLWGGIDALDDYKIVIIWKDAHQMAVVSGSDYNTAIEILADLSMSLGNPEYTDGNPKEVCIIITN